MSVRWMLADLRTGDVQDELPLILTDQLERAISKKMTSRVVLPVRDPACPPDWHQMIAGGRSMIVPVRDDAAAVPLHSYIVTMPTAGGPTVPLTLTSLEVILEAANVHDHDFYDTDESRIIETLVADKIAGEFGLELDVTDCGRVSDQTYSWVEDMTVAEAASALARRRGGPEYTTRVRWADSSQSRFEKVLEVSGEIGRRIESTVFENDHVAERIRPRDWTPGRDFATVVQAVGDGDADARLMSRIMVDQGSVDAGTPEWFTRVTTSMAQTEAEIDDYAIAQLCRMRYGAQSWELVLNLAEASCPQPVTDFDAGDTVTMALDPTRDDPASWHGPARIIGWRMLAQQSQLTQFTPVFWDPTELEEAA